MSEYLGPEEEPRLSPTEKRQLGNIVGVCGVIALGGAGLEIVDWFMESISFQHAGAYAALCAIVYGGTLLPGVTSSEQG